MNPESKLMHQIMAALSEKGCFVLRTNSGVYYDSQGNRITIGFKGLSDLVGFRPDGKFFALEIKTATGRPSPEQIKFIDFCRSKSIPAGIARSVEEALQILEVEN
jgi:hypothetical protein